MSRAAVLLLDVDWLRQDLQRQHGVTLVAQVGVIIHGDFANQSLKWPFQDEEVCCFLIAPNLAQGHRSGPITVRLDLLAG